MRLQPLCPLRGSSCFAELTKSIVTSVFQQACCCSSTTIRCINFIPFFQPGPRKQTYWKYLPLQGSRNNTFSLILGFYFHKCSNAFSYISNFILQVVFYFLNPYLPVTAMMSCCRTQQWKLLVNFCCICLALWAFSLGGLTHAQLTAGCHCTNTANQRTATQICEKFRINSRKRNNLLRTKPSR